MTSALTIVLRAIVAKNHELRETANNGDWEQIERRIDEAIAGGGSTGVDSQAGTA